MSIFFKSELEKEFKKLEIKNLNKLIKGIDNINKPSDYEIEFKNLKVDISKLKDYCNKKLNLAINELTEQDIKKSLNQDKEISEERLLMLKSYKQKSKDIIETIQSIVGEKTEIKNKNTGISIIIGFYRDFLNARNGGFANVALYKVGWNEINNSNDRINEANKKIKKNQVDLINIFEKLEKSISMKDINRANVRISLSELLSIFREIAYIFGNEIL